MSKKYIVALIRVSTLSQDLIQQREKVVEECHKLGYDDDHIILLEDKESAVKLSEEERNGLNNMKYYIESNSDIDCVISYELSRISRQAGILYSIRDFLASHHVQLIIMNPYFKMLKDDGSLSETSNIFFGIFSSMAENEGFLRKERTARGRAIKKANGQWLGGKIQFGYRVNKYKKLEPDPRKVEVIKWIFEQYAKGNHSSVSLGKELEKNGMLNNLADTDYYTKRVWSILHCDRYIGKDPMYPAIISEELFEKVQKILKKNQEKNKRGKCTESKFLLRGVIRDKESDKLMSACTNSKGYLAKGGRNLTPFSVIDPLVWEECKKQYRGHTDNDILRDRVSRELKDASIKYENCIEKIKILQARLDAIEERLILGRISQSKADNMEASSKAQIKQEYKNRLSYIDKMSSCTAILSEIKKKSDDDSELADLDNYDLDSRIKLIRQVIKVVYISREARDESKEKNITLVEIHNNYNDSVYRYKYMTHKNRYKGARYERIE